MYRYFLFSLVLLLSQIFFLDTYAQRKAIAGDIIDSVSGKKISNVNIFESLAGIGTITNPMGNFRLLLNQGAVQLSVSVSGYKTWVKEFVLQSDTVMNITLQPLKEADIASTGGTEESKSKAGINEPGKYRQRH
jgi:hypothetical protein